MCNIMRNIKHTCKNFNFILLVVVSDFGMYNSTLIYYYIFMFLIHLKTEKTLYTHFDIIIIIIIII